MDYRVQFTWNRPYFTLSRLFLAHGAMLDYAILEQETLPDDGSYYGGDERRVHSRVRILNKS